LSPKPYALAAALEFLNMLIIMSLSFASTSSNVQEYLMLFWHISRPEVATPPAFAAFAGAHAIAGCFSPCKASTPGQAFSGENACEVILQFLVHAIHITYFTCASSDIACRYICVFANMSCQFKHKTLAEFHNFSVGFTLGIEIAAAFCAAHRKAVREFFRICSKPRRLLCRSSNGVGPLYHLTYLPEKKCFIPFKFKALKHFLNFTSMATLSLPQVIAIS